MTWRDPAGKALADHPHPSVAVDVALLTVLDDGRLAVLVHERGPGHATGRWSLPGTFVHEGERLREAALRALRDKAGVTGQEPEQLAVFDDPARDDRGRVLSVAHVDLVPYPAVAGGDRTFAPVEGTRAVPPGARDDLAFDHDAIVERAVDWARALYRARPDPRRLAGPAFTLLDLQRLHEAVLGRPLQKDTFRRGVRGALEPTGGMSRGAVGKPARLFRHRPG